MSKWHGGKGSDQRPVDTNKFGENWDRIFGKKEEEKMEEFTYAIWPDGTICEQEFIGEMLTFKSDDYVLITAEDEDEALDMAKVGGWVGMINWQERAYRELVQQTASWLYELDRERDRIWEFRYYQFGATATDRYREDPVFRNKIRSLVSRLLPVIDGAVANFQEAKNG